MSVVDGVARYSSDWNLLRERNHLSVIDWEGARVGPARCDALRLVTTGLHAVRHARDTAGEVHAVLLARHAERLFDDVVPRLR